MTPYQITRINKRNSHYYAHERISNIGGIANDGVRWKFRYQVIIPHI